MECRVEEVVDVPARQIEEMSQYPGDTIESVEFRKFFIDVHRQGLTFHELGKLWLQLEMDAVAVEGGVARKGASGSQSSETKGGFPLSERSPLERRRFFSPSALQRLHPEY